MSLARLHQQSSGTSLKIYVTLEKANDFQYKKLVLMIGGTQMIFELKRKIEKEFSELFPTEPPYVVAKLQDQNGYALSSNSKAADVLTHNDVVSAMQDMTDEGVLHGGRDSREHILLL